MNMQPNEVRCFAHPLVHGKVASLAPSFDGVYCSLNLTVRRAGAKYADSMYSFKCMPDAVDWLKSRGYLAAGESQ